MDFKTHHVRLTDKPVKKQWETLEREMKSSLTVSADRMWKARERGGNGKRWDRGRREEGPRGEEGLMDVVERH